MLNKDYNSRQKVSFNPDKKSEIQQNSSQNLQLSSPDQIFSEFSFASPNSLEVSPFEIEIPKYGNQSTNSIFVNLGTSEEQESSNLSSSTVSSEVIYHSVKGFKFFDSLYICPTNDIPRESVGYHSSKTYEIRDYEGNRVYFAAEEENCMMRFTLSECRPFETNIYDLAGRIILSINRPMTCWICVFGMDSIINCSYETTATANKLYLGRVKPCLNFSRPTYAVEDMYGKTIYNIPLPTCGYWLICRLCRMKEVHICQPDSHISVGKIQLGYDGLSEDKISNPKTVSVIFPPHCSPELKACLMAAGFMMEITYFHHHGCTFHRSLRYFLGTAILVAIFGGVCYGMNSEWH